MISASRSFLHHSCFDRFSARLQRLLAMRRFLWSLGLISGIGSSHAIMFIGQSQ